jgi:zinc protease
MLFEPHPYRFPLKGTEESVAAIECDDIVQWHEARLASGGLVIGLSGDVEGEEARDAIFEAFEGLSKREPFSYPGGPIEKTRRIRERTESMEKRQAAFSLGFLGPSLHSPSQYAFNVLTHMLSGMGSRLFIFLRDVLGLAYLVGCSYEARLDAGFFRAYITTSIENIDRAKRALLGELLRLRDEKPGEEELQRAKNYIIGLHEISLQKCSVRASRYAYFELMGLGYDHLSSYPRRIQMVTPVEVQYVAREFLDPEAYVSATMLPDSH